MKSPWIFNALITVLILAFDLIRWLLKTPDNAPANIEKFIPIYSFGIEVRAVIVFAVLFSALFLGAAIIHRIWNFLLPKIFGINLVSYSDAYCIMLAITFLSSVVE